MKKYIVLGLLLNLVTACVITTKKAQSVPSNQSYLSPEPHSESVRVSPIGPPIQEPGVTTHDSNLSAVIGSAAVAAVYGATEGIAKVMRNNDVKSANYVSGVCYYGEEERQFATSPCSRVTVKLLDADTDKELARTSTDETGSFRFYVPSSKSYHLEVVDRRGRSSHLKQRISRAEMVSIYLKP